MPWDRELAVLEEALRRLGAEYDAFLYGTASRPPVKSHKHVAQMIRMLANTAADSAADRYRFATLQGRYNALCEKWERLQEEKEAGRRPGLYGHFGSGGGVSPVARPSAPSAPAAAPPLPNAQPPSSVSEGGDASPPAPAERELFDRYVSAKKALGEKVEGYRYEQFVESLAKEREKLQERLGGEDIVFDVAEREGKVRLVARRRAAEGRPKT